MPLAGVTCSGQGINDKHGLSDLFAFAAKGERDTKHKVSQVLKMFDRNLNIFDLVLILV